jgi:hypothetical protein
LIFHPGIRIALLRAESPAISQRDGSTMLTTQRMPKSAPSHPPLALPTPDGAHFVQEELRELAADILRRFRCHVGALSIDLAAGGLVLHGLAFSYYGKQLVLHEVMTRARFPIRANCVEVAPARTPAATIAL